MFNPVLWMPAADILKPDSVLVLPKNSFLAAYESSEGVVRTFCACCGTNVILSMYPMPERWPEKLCISLGTVDREDLEKTELEPERHVWWDIGID